MIKNCFLLACVICISTLVFSQTVAAPDRIYGQLFTDVQMNKIFPDNKTFVDCIPKRNPQLIVADYLKVKTNKEVKFSLYQFVQDNFIIPGSPTDSFHTAANEDVKTHIIRLWTVLQRNPDKQIEGSSLLPLKGPYIVPGGRFREVYYWDSYFTMLGLQESNRYDLIEQMIQNFAFLVDKYGHIPNGNRSYYLSRSQPPFFSMMLGLLAEKNGDKVYTTYLPALEKEYAYWNDATAPTKHQVTMPDGSKLARYYDQGVLPRQESFVQDSTVGINFKGDHKLLYKNLRSGAESGWDFSTRWFANGTNISTIQTTNLIAVDLNCLLAHLEQTLSKAYALKGNIEREKLFSQKANKRIKAINKYLYNNADGWYYDYNIAAKQLSSEKTIAGITPFFFQVADKASIDRAATIVSSNYLKSGGVVTTLKNSGQQWDAPNGWAPLQYMTIKGLDNYGKKELAKEIATRWVNLNVKVYKNTGKLMEKYNVEDNHLEAGGGEYKSQDGFGWTNGVLLKLMSIYHLTGE